MIKMTMGIQHPNGLIGQLIDDRFDIANPVSSIEKQGRIAADDQVRDNLLPLKWFVNGPDVGLHFVHFKPVITDVAFFKIAIGRSRKPFAEFFVGKDIGKRGNQGCQKQDKADGPVPIGFAFDSL
jgi:hypothetical protein